MSLLRGTKDGPRTVSTNSKPPQVLPRLRGRDRHRRAGATAGARWAGGHSRAEPPGAAQTALPGEGEERDLPVYGRRSEPDRSVRPQAGARKMEWPAAPARDDEGHAARVHETECRRSGQPTQVHAAWEKRHRILRL